MAADERARAAGGRAAAFARPRDARSHVASLHPAPSPTRRPAATHLVVLEVLVHLHEPAPPGAHDVQPPRLVALVHLEDGPRLGVRVILDALVDLRAGGGAGGGARGTRTRVRARGAPPRARGRAGGRGSRRRRGPARASGPAARASRDAPRGARRRRRPGRATPPAHTAHHSGALARARGRRRRRGASASAPRAKRESAGPDRGVTHLALLELAKVATHSHRAERLRARGRAGSSARLCAARDYCV